MSYSVLVEARNNREDVTHHYIGFESEAEAQKWCDDHIVPVMWPKGHPDSQLIFDYLIVPD